MMRIISLLSISILLGFLGYISCDFVLNEFVLLAMNFVDYSIYINDAGFATNWVFGLALSVPSFLLVFFDTKSKFELIPVFAFAYLSAILLAILSISYHQIQYSMEEQIPFAYGVLVEAFQLEYCALFGSIFGSTVSIFFLRRRQRRLSLNQSNEQLIDNE